MRRHTVTCKVRADSAKVACGILPLRRGLLCVYAIASAFEVMDLSTPVSFCRKHVRWHTSCLALSISEAAGTRATGTVGAERGASARTGFVSVSAPVATDCSDTAHHNNSEHSGCFSFAA
jgi:hypothetical protein